MANDQEEIKCFRKIFHMFLFLTISQHFAGNNNKKKFVNNCCFGKTAFSLLYGNNPATTGWQQFDNKLILDLILILPLYGNILTTTMYGNKYYMATTSYQNRGNNLGAKKILIKFAIKICNNMKSAMLQLMFAQRPFEKSIYILRPAYAQHTPSIRPAYAQHTPSIRPAYAQHTPSIRHHRRKC